MHFYMEIVQKVVFTEPEVKILKLELKHMIPSQIYMFPKMIFFDLN